MAVNKRWALWLCLLAGTVAAALYPVHSPAVQVQAELAEPRRARATSADMPSAHIAAAAPMSKEEGPNKADSTEGAINDPFSPVDWDAAPPPPPPPPLPTVKQAPVIVAPPPAPIAPQEPPLPFRFLGKMEEDGNTVIYLARGEDTVVAHSGDSLDAQYKLVSVNEHKLTIEYLPMGTQHDISLDAP